MSKMPEWTEDQVSTINDRYWQGQEIPCPLCGAEVQVILSQRQTFPKYMRAICRGCGADASFHSAPERGEDFDQEQAKEIVSLYLRRKASACNLDGTPLKVTHHSVLGGPGFYSVRCPRCGAFSGEITWEPGSRQ